MAMNLIVLLAVTSVYSTNESSNEFQPYFNLTLNGTFERTADWNVSDESDDEESLLGGTSSRGGSGLSFWEAWEAHNSSFLESYEFISPLPSKAMAVTEAFLDVVTTSSAGDEYKMTSPTVVPSEVTTYSQEDQVNKPAIDLWPVKLAAEVPGDLIIGGLMMVHEREDTITCGPIMPQGGIQAVETMLYTLDNVNKGLEHFRIGVHILDDCDKDTYGLEMAVDFIKGKKWNHSTRYYINPYNLCLRTERTHLRQGKLSSTARTTQTALHDELTLPLPSSPSAPSVHPRRTVRPLQLRNSAAKRNFQEATAAAQTKIQKGEYFVLALMYIFPA
ncbi:hypothetical protein GE061_015508 [Apolygus lucorum]|uniref:Receptor ligand binding region domain-containing protein n=1 Tax=Apolygus lucorum TaxID=248454 RepID=A0A8S9XND9_APOLU|nr:hypothetical protein GE061_015508 [Apolygus lucorum]